MLSQGKMLPKKGANAKTHSEDTIFVQYLKRFFRLTGRNVAARPYFFIFICLFITVLSSSSILLTKMTNNVTDFTPKDARALRELKIYNDFFGQKGYPIVVFVFITAKDSGSMLGVAQLNETVKLLDLIVNNVEIRNEQMNETRIFAQFCTSFCEANEPVRNVYNSLMINEQFNGTSAQIDLAYPVSTILGQRFRIDDNFFGVQIGKRNSLLGARLVLLQFRAILQGDIDSTGAERYEMAVNNFIQKNFTSNIINAVTMSSTLITAEIVRAGISLLPFTAIGFIIMCIFSTVTTIVSSVLVSQFHYLQVVTAILACVSPLLACSTALGFLLWGGLRFGSILCVTPLLVLAIGVDDAFLMMNHWQQTYQQKMVTKELSKERISKRMCNMLQEVGPSITITTLTNVLAFGVGMLSPIPEIQIFCIGNATAMIVDFIYQITLFAAIMVVVGRCELQAEKSMYPVKYKKRKDLLNKYCSVLCTTSFSVLTVAGLLLYWSLSIYGAVTISVELKPEKLIKHDSDIVKVLQLRDEYIMQHCAPTLIFVGRPGNLNNPNNIRMLHKIAEDFEALPSSLGKTATKFWLRDYMDFIANAEQVSFDSLIDSNRNNEIYEFLNRNLTAITIKQFDLQNFFAWPEFHHWNGFVQFDLDKHGMGYLKSYFFIISSHSDLRKWSARAKLLNQLRKVADRYAMHEVSVFDDDAKFLDIIEVLVNQTVQSSIFTVLFMMFVCFICIPQCTAVIVATFSIISVLGLLSLWNVDLDPIVMSALIMSIGFSVDIPAHVTYHFFLADEDTTEASLQHCLKEIGFPVLQAAFSTMLCVLSLQFSDLHMALVFVKTMSLVIIIGFIHGLVVIPVLYCIISRIRYPRRKVVFDITATTCPKAVAVSEHKTVKLTTDTELKISAL
uniref:SSD domain-containing protein n=1 Tax=Wuchereria bancrofti TaxID=6293 RepID=A0A1I8F0D1_WUCBA